MIWCTRVALVMVLPLLLAAVGVQEFRGSRDVAAAPSIAHALLWGPLLETALLLAVARLVDRVMGQAGSPRPKDATVTHRFVACTAVVGVSFWAAHTLQNGHPAWATLPMALLMAAYAARHADDSPGTVCRRAGPTLFTMHAMYNGGVLVFQQFSIQALRQTGRWVSGVS